jgi:hypothetical protein
MIEYASDNEEVEEEAGDEEDEKLDAEACLRLETKKKS